MVVAPRGMKAIFSIFVLSTPGPAGNLPNGSLEAGVWIVVKERASLVFGKMDHNNKVKPCLHYLYKEVRQCLASKILQKVEVPSAVSTTNLPGLLWEDFFTEQH